MLYTVKEDIDLCIDLKVSPSQLMFLKMLVDDPGLEPSESRKRRYALAIKFQREAGGLSPAEIADLIARNVVIDHNSFGKQFLEYYEIHDDFLRKFTLKVYPIASELHDNYPHYFNDAAGKRYIAKSCGPEDIALKYLKAINNDPIEHKRVLEDLEWAKKHKAIVLGLKKFVDAKYWLAIRELRVKEGNSKNSADVRIL